MSGSVTKRNARMREMAAAGVSHHDIAATFKIAEGRVASILSRPGWPGLTGAARDARDAAMVARVDAGEAVATVAASYGISAYTAKHKIAEWRRMMARPTVSAPVEPTGPVVLRPARLVPVRVIGWGEFGPEVEALDPAVAAADAAPFRGGRYPRAPTIPCFGGSPAQACVERGRGMA